MTELKQLFFFRLTLNLQQICCTVSSEKNKNKKKKKKKKKTADLHNLLDNAKKKKKNGYFAEYTKKFEEDHNVFTISLIVLMAA